MKLAAVPYINALPLIYYLKEHPRLAPPAALERLLKIGEVDLATAPITTLLLNPEFRIVPGLAIGTRGPVQSVRLILKKPGMALADVRSIYLDMESRTSVLLLKVLLRFKYNLDLDKIHFMTPVPAPDVDAVLLIGDKALDGSVGATLRGCPAPEGGHGEGGHIGPPLQYDLGQEWCSWTGLPFVFAAWISPKKLIDTQIIQDLTQARDRALQDLGPILDTITFLPRAAAEEYLKKNISYDLGKEEIAGIARFHGYLKEMKIVTGDFQPRFF